MTRKPTEKSKQTDSLVLNQALFLLKTFYEKIVEVLDVFCGSGLIVKDDRLNFYYIQLKTNINTILEYKEFETLGDPPVLFESLVGDVRDADIDWENGGQQSANQFLGRITNLFIKSGSHGYKLPGSTNEMLISIDSVIAKHQDFTDKSWKTYQKNELDQLEQGGRSHTDATEVGISYQSESGVGYVNNKRFKFKDDQPEYSIFSKLFNNIGHKMPRAKVLELMGLIECEKPLEYEGDKQKHPVNKSQATYKINEVVKKIRSATGLNTDSLVNNNGNLTLVGNHTEPHPKVAPNSP